MSHQTNRRNFLKTSAAAAGVGYWAAGGVTAKASRSALEQVNFACIGIGGKGSSDSGDAKRHGNVVAICDIDEGRLDGVTEKFPHAKKFFDYRRMLETMDKSIDAVTVSIPDHSHAPAGLMAMRMGKHCFCQKPMTHSLYEARLMGKVARENKVATQMGNQGTAGSMLRKAAAVIKAGALGKIKEAHVWTNRPVWPQDGGPATPAEPTPKGVEWNLWIGPAKYRPYGKRYHPFAWRGWWDYGTGALGDMACHTLNMPFMALDLFKATSMEAHHSGHSGVSYPKSSKIVYEFAPHGDRPAINMTWYDGGNLPPAELFDGEEVSESGSLIIGEKGKLYSPGDYAGGPYKLLGDVDEPEVEFKVSPGHFTEWVNAIKGGEPAMSNFPGYATPLTEVVLLGNLALWAGKKVEWDAENLKATNAPELDEIIKPIYGPGYTLDV